MSKDQFEVKPHVRLKSYRHSSVEFHLSSHLNSLPDLFIR